METARDAAEQFIVLAATALEVACVLESTRADYGWDRHSVAEAVEAVVDEPAFAVEHGSVLRAAAATCRERSIDLHDCFLAAVAVERGTRVLSLDDDLRRLGAAERPQDLTRR